MRLNLASLHPRILSGQIDSLAGLGRALDRRGHDVRLIAPFDAAGLLHTSLLELDTGPRRLTEASRAMLRAVPRIVAASRGSELLHLALPTPAFGWVADMVRLATRTPVLVTFEGHLAQVGQLLQALRRPTSLTGYLPLWLVNNGLFGRASAHLCQGYVVSSEYQREELVALGVPAERINVLSNMIDDGKLEALRPSDARQQLGLPAGRPMIGYIGHFNDVKGVDVLAEAFVSLIDSGRDFELALAWSGQGSVAPIQNRLHRVRSHVTWLSKVHVGAFMAAIDVLALPYRATAGQGAFPSLVLEALHAGRPLVTTALPLLNEIAQDEQVALVCPPNRPDLLAQNLDRLLTSELLRHRMSKQQMQLAHERFAPELLVRRYEAIYASLIDQKSELTPAAA